KHLLIAPIVLKNNDLIRKRNKIGLPVLEPSRSLFGELQTEYKIGLLVLAVLNLLLLAVNVIDIQWVWIGFEVPLHFNLRQFVHEGTYLLILSILISIGIVLYLFRGSLNFHPKNKWLKILGKAWIIQNV